jgi:hypothetical protein
MLTVDFSSRDLIVFWIGFVLNGLLLLSEFEIVPAMSLALM